MQIIHSSIEYDMTLSYLFTPGDDAYAVYLLLLYYCGRIRCSIIYRNIVVMFVTLLLADYSGSFMMIDQLNQLFASLVICYRFDYSIFKVVHHN